MIWRGWALPPTAPEPPVYQSERSAVYAQYFEELARRGLVYPCFCSRSQLHAASAPHRSDGQVVYAGTCRNLTAAEIAEKSKTRAPAWRVCVPDEVIAFEDGHIGPCAENLARDCGDFYLRRADGVLAYSWRSLWTMPVMGSNEGRARQRSFVQHGAPALALPRAGPARPAVLPSAAAAGQ